MIWGSSLVFIWVNSKAGSSHCWKVVMLCRVPQEADPERMADRHKATELSGKAKTEISGFDILPV